MLGGKGPSFYAGDWAAITALNGSTLMYGWMAPPTYQRPGTYTLWWNQTQWLKWLGVTLYIGTDANGKLTTRNQLVVKTDCKTVVTSYTVSQ